MGAHIRRHLSVVPALAGLVLGGLAAIAPLAVQPAAAATTFTVTTTDVNPAGACDTSPRAMSARRPRPISAG